MTQANRRVFFKTIGALAAGALLPKISAAVGTASQINIAQVVYSGGNWQPHPTALRRLAWEIHKRTAIDSTLEPDVVKPIPSQLAGHPLLYLAGDRPFPKWRETAVEAMARFFRLGGTLIVDPADVKGVNAEGFENAIDTLLHAILPEINAAALPQDHVLFRSFYQISRPVGRVEGPSHLLGYELNGRLAVIRTKHDLGGAWSRDNLGNWELDVVPGGDRQRENAFRLGINLVFYTLCQNYKNETPHRRFGGSTEE